MKELLALADFRPGRHRDDGLATEGPGPIVHHGSSLGAHLGGDYWTLGQSSVGAIILGGGSPPDGGAVERDAFSSAQFGDGTLPTSRDFPYAEHRS